MLLGTPRFYSYTWQTDMCGHIWHVYVLWPVLKKHLPDLHPPVHSHSVIATFYTEQALHWPRFPKQYWILYFVFIFNRETFKAAICNFYRPIVVCVWTIKLQVTCPSQITLSNKHVIHNNLNHFYDLIIVNPISFLNPTKIVMLVIFKCSIDTFCILFVLWTVISI